MVTNPYKALIVELEKLTQKAFELKIWIALPEIKSIAFFVESLNGEIEDYYIWGTEWHENHIQSFLNKLNACSQSNLDINDFDNLDRIYDTEITYLNTIFDVSAVGDYYKHEFNSENIFTLNRPKEDGGDLRTALLETQVQIADILSKLQTL